jgi:hypothetical protein
VGCSVGALDLDGWLVGWKDGGIVGFDVGPAVVGFKVGLIGFKVGRPVGFKLGATDGFEEVTAVVSLASSNDGNDIDEMAMINFKEVGEDEGVCPLITTRLEKKRIIKAGRAIFTGCKSDGGQPLTHSTPMSLNPCKFVFETADIVQYW